MPTLDDRHVDAIDAAIGMTARTEEFSIAFLSQVCAQEGFEFVRWNQDYQAVDGDIKFRETDLRVQLKSTVQDRFWNDEFSFSLQKEWLVKWSESKIPVILVLVVLNSPDGKWATHAADSTSFPARGYWKRVDEFARKHVDMRAQSKSVRFSIADRITSDSVTIWHKVAMSPFGGRV